MRLTAGAAAYFRTLKDGAKEFFTIPRQSPEDSTIKGVDFVAVEADGAISGAQEPPPEPSIPKEHWIRRVSAPVTSDIPVLRLHTAWTCAKEPLHEDQNEDVFVWNPASGAAAVLDGATESFSAQRWAKLLASRWNEGAANWVELATADYEEVVSALDLSWAQEAASSRGSFATLATVRAITGGFHMEIVGDSNIFFISETKMESFPFTDPAEFTSAPIALESSVRAIEVNQLVVRENSAQIATLSGLTHVVLATDAVAAWLLDPDEASSHFHALLEIQSEDDFRSLVHQQRELGSMKTDDSTVLILTVGGQ